MVQNVSQLLCCKKMVRNPMSTSITITEYSKRNGQNSYTWISSAVISIPFFEYQINPIEETFTLDGQLYIQKTRKQNKEFVISRG